MKFERDIYTDRLVAVERPPTAACERGTEGCCIAHSAEAEDGECETW